MAKEANEYSGKWLQRVPRRMHLELQRRAKIEGVSLNALVACILATGVAKREAARKKAKSHGRV